MRDQVGERPGFAEDYETERLKARGVAPPVPDSEIQDRIARLRELMARDGFSAVLVYGAPDEPSWIRYLANYVHPFVIAESFLLVAPEGDPILFTDREWFLPQIREMAPFSDVRVIPYVEFPWQFPQLVEVLETALRDLRVESGTLGICELDMPAVYARALSDVSLPLEFRDATQVLSLLVEAKSEYDQVMVRRSASIGDAVMWEALRTCGEGVPEYEVGIAAERVAVARGAEWGSGTQSRTHIYVASSSEIMSNVRPYHYTGRRLEAGDMFFIDLSVCYRGYYTDFCRTVSIGPPSDKQRFIFDSVMACQMELKEALKPGLTGEDVFNLGMDSIRRHSPEYVDYVNFVWFGHGTGLIISEPPFFLKGEKRQLKANTFINTEPGLFVPGVGTTSIEDMLFLTDAGAEFVTDCPRELHEAPTK